MHCYSVVSALLKLDTGNMKEFVDRKIYYFFRIMKIYEKS